MSERVLNRQRERERERERDRSDICLKEDTASTLQDIEEKTVRGIITG